MRLSRHAISANYLQLRIIPPNLRTYTTKRPLDVCQGKSALSQLLQPTKAQLLKTYSSRIQNSNDIRRRKRYSTTMLEFVNEPFFNLSISLK